MLISPHTREPAATVLVKKILQPGMICIDIGANIGYYALIEARIVGDSGLVYAIEPVKRNVEVLTKSIEENGYTNIFSYNLAIGSKNEMLPFQMMKQSSWGNMMSEGDRSCHVDDKVKKYGTELIKVQTLTLDRFVSDHIIDRQGQVDFIRMDVEGYETEIIKGAHKTFKGMETGGILFIEFHPKHYKKREAMTSEAINAIMECGFKPKFFNPSWTTMEVLYEPAKQTFSSLVAKYKAPLVFFEKEFS